MVTKRTKLDEHVYRGREESRDRSYTQYIIRKSFPTKTRGRT